MPKDLILIVDDNPQNIQFLATLLDKAEYEVGVAMDGEQALDFLRQETPELVLLDVMMPGIDGFETCRRIKGNHDWKHIPVIFLTAKDGTDDLVQGFEIGAVDYVTKPFKSVELLARIRTHIALKKAREELVTLRGLIPVCSYCKKIRQDDGLWKGWEKYIVDHTDADLSHGVCPTCLEKVKAETLPKPS